MGGVAPGVAENSWESETGWPVLSGKVKSGTRWPICGAPEEAGTLRASMKNKTEATQISSERTVRMVPQILPP